MVQQKNVRKDSRLQRQIEELQKRMDAVEDILDNTKEVGSIISGRGSPLHGHSPQFTLQNDIRQKHPFLSAKRQDDLLRESGHSGMDKEEPRNVCHVR